MWESFDALYLWWPVSTVFCGELYSVFVAVLCVRETESQRMTDGDPYLQRKSDNYSERTF